MRNIFVILVLILYVIVGLPYQLFLLIVRLFSERMSVYLTFQFLKLVSNSLFIAAGTNIHVEGEQNLNTNKTHLIIANHLSLLDTPLLIHLAKQPISFIAKKEISKVPILNLWVYLLSGLFLDRSSIKKGFKIITSGIEKLNNGYNMAVFPQGTRDKTGEFIPFKRGTFKLVTDSGSTLIPVAIFGTDRIYESNGKSIRKADVYVHIFEPIETENMTKEEQKQLSKQAEKLVYDKYTEFKNKTF